jgi:hypothetical protein
LRWHTPEPDQPDYPVTTFLMVLGIIKISGINTYEWRKLAMGVLKEYIFISTRTN